MKSKIITFFLAFVLIQFFLRPENIYAEIINSNSNKDTMEFDSTYNLSVENTSQTSDIIQLKNKKVVVFGDSIAWGQVGINTGKQAVNNWPKVFGDLTQTVISNKAIPGTCLAQGNGYGMTDEFNSQAFCNRVDTEDFSDVDYLLIAYGTNDYGFVIPMGDDDSSHLKNTFKGALHYSLTKLSKKYPDLKIILLTPMYAPSSLVKNLKGYTMTDYVEAIKDVASQYRVPVIDLHNGMGINAKNYQSLYWDPLHPIEKTYTRMATFIAQMFPGEVPISKNEVKNLLPLLGGYNLIKYGDFAPTGTAGEFSNMNMENGVTISVSPGKTKASIAFLKLIPNETLYITFWCKSRVNKQYFEADLFDTKILVNSSYLINKGEQFVTLKFDIPDNVDVNKNYILRFTSNTSNTSNLYFSSLMLTRSSVPMSWAPAPGEEKDMSFKEIMLESPTTSGAVIASYRKNGNGNVQLRGIVNVTDKPVVGKLPVECAPDYNITTTIVTTDGVVTFAIINTSGVISVGITNKSYDLSSIPAYYAGVADVRNE